MVSNNESVPVDLHCHSDASDGYYTPEVLADKLAETGVHFAALTDHCTVTGQSSFRSRAARHGIIQVMGAELHARFNGAEIHLLAYGFDPERASFQLALGTTVDAEQAIDAVHEAGGIVFLAHPLHNGWTWSGLEETVTELVAAGLDGIEAYYKPYTAHQQKKLVSLADRLGILTSAGSDFHGRTETGSQSPGVRMPLERWTQFRAALSEHALNGESDEPGARAASEPLQHNGGRIDWRWLSLRIALPSLLVIGAFIGLLFAVLIPTMEQRLLERKREMIRELTNSAWSIVADYEREVREGNLTLDQAQQAAIDRVRRLRYGPAAKDYFWITDMHPRMIMHPYREDLEGRDLSDFTDRDGVRPFVEFVRAVENESSGFVTYVWQWLDDPERLEPKESYVRRFSPWDWIIGTGLYVDDVQEEIGTITGRMVDASFVVTLLAAVLLFSVAYQSLKVERRRSEAERDLRRSHERYRALVESSTSGTLLVVDGRCTYANRALLDLLGYTAGELSFLHLNDLLASDRTGDGSLQRLVNADETSEPFEAWLRHKEGRDIPVLLSSTTVRFSGRVGTILSVQDISRHRAMQNEAERDRLVSQLQTSLLFLTDPVRESMRSPVSCSLGATIAHVVRIMNRNDVDAVTITSDDGTLIGIVTDHDIRERVVATGLDREAPVSRIMSAPVVTIHENAPLFEAFLLERERNIEHLAVVDSSDTLVGTIRSSRALQPDRYSPAVLTHQIHRARTVEELSDCHERLPGLVGSLVESGALPRNICHVTSAAADAIARRVIALTLEEIGPAPGRFAFVALGSEARQEQTLVTDQDNALVFEDAGSDSEEIREFYRRLGALVCDRLDRAGYRHCENEAMARDPRWNQPLQQWKEYMSGWISEPDEQAIAHCNVFFDLRPIYGDSSLVRELWRHVSRTLEDRPAFFSFMAQNTVRYKPPVGLFGRIVTGSSGESANTFNIKDAMTPIVNFARLYALKHRLEETNTFERLDRIFATGVLSEESYRGVYQAYEHLMQLRYRHQVDMVREGIAPDNSIDPAALTQLELGTLKNTFSQINIIQKKVAYEFRTA